MEKKQDQGAKNITKSGVNRTAEKILSQAGTLTVIINAVRHEITGFEELLEKDTENKEEKPRPS